MSINTRLRRRRFSMEFLFSLGLACSLSVFSANIHAQDGPEDSRLKPQRELRDAYHPWTPPASLEEWKVESDKIRRQVLVSNGLWPLPERTPLNAVIHGKIDRDSYTVEKVYFASRPGQYVTGNLYRPKKINGKVPGVLCPHGHWKDGRFYDAGDGAQAQMESGAEQFEAGAHFPLQARMVQLARMGCVVFHYDMVGYADNQPLDHRTGFNDAQAALWLHNIMGLQTWSSIRSLDFLESLPEVDPNRLAVTGSSGGGTQTMILAAVDPRVAVSFPAVMVSTGMQGGCVCENASYLRQDVNNVAFAALFAPKPQSMSGADDWTIEIESKGLPELKQVYSLYDRADLVEAHAFPQFKHNYNQVSRQVMYSWFDEHLGLNGPIVEADFEPLSREELSVFDAEHPLPDDALDASALRKTMIQADRDMFQSLLKSADRYQKVIGGAAQVMLQPEQPTSRFEKIDTRKTDRGVSFTRGIVTNSDGVMIRTVVLQKEGIAQKAGTVFWFGSAGFRVLQDAQPDVMKLLDAGYTVVSAALFLTRPEDATEHYKVNDQYPGYTYGYNRPLITERVRDILAVIDALPERRRGDSVTLIGTGDAGVWSLLARCVMNADDVDQTLVDISEFSFDSIDSTQDPNLLPGALKYGGLPGLLGLDTNKDIAIFGATNAKPFETILRGDSRISISEENLSTSTIVEKLID